MSGVITYQMVIDQSGAVKSIKQVEETLRSSETAFDNQTKAINRNTKALGQQERTANLAGMAALELSRVISDSAYGIRGIANNIGQLVTIFAMMSVQVNATTGSVLGLMGALRATWRALWGPMGVVFLIQGLLSALTVWESRTNKQRKAQERLNKELEATLRHLKPEKTAAEIKTLIELLDGVTGAQAQKDLESIIPNYERLREAMSVKDIMESYRRYLILKENEGRLSDIVSKETAKENKMKREGVNIEGTTLKVIGDRVLQSAEYIKSVEAREEAERVLMITMQERLKLENLFRKDPKEKDTLEGVLDGFEYLDLLSRLDFKGDFFDAKGWVDAYFGEFSDEKLVSINDQLRDAARLLQQLGYINAKPMFGNDSLEGIRVFAHHLDAISGTMFAMGNTFSNVADIIDDGSDRMEERLKILYDLQQGFAVASITIDTLVALAKVNAQTGVLGTLQSAQIIAQGVAGITAVLAQKPGRSSQLKGAKNSNIGTAQDDTVPVTTTGFSNLAGGEKPNQDIRVYVMGSDIRSVQDRSTRTKVRAKL